MLYPTVEELKSHELRFRSAPSAELITWARETVDSMLEKNGMEMPIHFRAMCCAHLLFGVELGMLVQDKRHKTKINDEDEVPVTFLDI